MKRATKKLIKKFLPKGFIPKIKEVVNGFGIDTMAKQKRISFDRNKYEFGINLVGLFSEDSGIGQSTRLVARELDDTSIPHHFIDFYREEYTVRSNKEFEDKITDEYKYGINLIHVNMDDFLYYYKRSKEHFQGRYNIAFWLWEVPEFPQRWVPMINQLDEIWTPAEYVSDALRKVTDKPVKTIPYNVQAPFSNKYNRGYFNLPENLFLCLMMFDSRSISERKNPFGCIEAFKNAFSKEDKVGIVVKIGYAEEEELTQIKQSLEGYQVFFINTMLSKVEVNSLIHDVDVYISLHRAEGFGLVLAESMLMKTATVASNYSANTEFQTKENACLVDCTTIPVGQDIYPFKKEYTWGDPNLKQASEFLSKLYNDKEYYESIVDKAYNDMSSFDRRRVPMKLIEDRVKEIYETF